MTEELTLEMLETWSDVDLIQEVLALQEELEKTRVQKAHVEIGNENLAKEVERLTGKCSSLEKDCRIWAGWYRGRLNDLQEIECTYAAAFDDEIGERDALLAIKAIIEGDEND